MRRPGWPLVGSTRTLHLDAAGALADVPGSEGEDRYKVDFTVGTGANTRHERLAAEDTRDYYGDWQGRDARMLRYTSEPLSDDAEVSGHPVVDLWLSSSEGDAAVHVYLSEVEADGTVRYVTEGVLRAIHRKEIRARAAAALELALSDLRPGRCACRCRRESRSACVSRCCPTSWTFRRGSRLRLAIAGADADHYAQVPHGRPPLLTIQRGGAMASVLTLPWRSGAGS